MRYICLLVILLALPETVAAQVNIRAGRNPGPPPSGTSNAGPGDRSAAPSNDGSERTAVPRSNAGSRESANDGSRGGSNGRFAVRADEDDRQNGRRNDRNNRQNDRGHQRGNDRQNDRPTTGLGPLGLPPVAQQPLPWWERQQTPWWEQRQVPVWEQKNPARVMLDQERDARRLAKHPRPRNTQPPIVYVLPPYRYFNPGTTYSYGVESTTYITPAPPGIVVPPPAPEIETGFLRLEVEPRQLLQVFVDGLYIGTPADLGDEFELRLGARRIELRAPGYRTLIFDTQIVPDRTIVYRGALEPITTAAPVTPAPIAPAAPVAPDAPAARDARDAPDAVRSTIYMIPGCYIGNVAPTADMVRAGCDLSKVITRAPQ